MGAWGRQEASTTFAPDVAPVVMSHDWVHRSPVLVVATDNARVEIDLDGLTADNALGFIDRLRDGVVLFGEQWKEWEERAALDRAGPYVIPPVPYGIAGDVSAGGEAARDDGPADAGDGDAAGSAEGGV